MFTEKDQKRSFSKKTVWVLPALALLAACSAKIDGGSPASAPADYVHPQNDGFFDSRPTLEGPSIEGHWLSGCHLKSETQTYRTFEFTVAAEKISRVEHLFEDSTCQNQKAEKSNSGRFRFIEKSTDGRLTVEYAFQQENVTVFPQEKILLQDGLLYISDFYIGDVDVLRDEPLSLVTAGSQPAPTPVLKPATLAVSYAEAKYAFCSNQGFGILINFKGTDLSKDGNGVAIRGYKTCGSSAPVKWGTQEAVITVKLENGKPQISFPRTQYMDNIRPYSYQSGLAGASGANSSLGGNSGECFFLTNDGTQNIPFGYACE